MTIIAILVGLYLTCILVLAALQDWFVFPRWMMRGGTVPLPKDARRLAIEVDASVTMCGVVLPATGDSALVIIGFGGNAWDADLLALYLRSVFPDADIVTAQYRGYGRSTGRPGAAAILTDALRLHDHVVALRPRVRVVAVGLSLGSGPAAHVARYRPVAGAILVTPFDTLGRVAADALPWVPVRMLLRHRMDVAGAMAGTLRSVAIVAAERDEVVRPARTDALRRACSTLVSDEVIQGVGHNDIYEADACAVALRSALDRVLEAGD